MFKVLSGNKLKLIALIAMVIDHVGDALISPLIGQGVFTNLYMALKLIGRMSFPIFAFLAVEGVMHTRNKTRYLLSILITAAASEYIYRLLFDDKCNVLFTLSLGIAMIILAGPFEKSIRMYVRWGLVLSVGLFISFIAGLDYGLRGVILMFVFYALSQSEKLKLIIGYIVMCFGRMGIFSLPGFYFISCYNGKRGRDLGTYKYIFYIFYPVHLLVLLILRNLIYG